MKTLLLILMSTFLVSIISFIGLLILILKEKFLEKSLLILVALSAGALIGGAFLHLIPEAIEQFSTSYIFLYVLMGFSLFFFTEKILHWRHCHEKKCEVHTFAYMNLFGDAVHNFIDGLIIASSFIIEMRLGIVTTLAVALHEIPQEIGDFGVLVYSGLKKNKALFLNFLSALTAIVGGLVGYSFSIYAKSFAMFLLPFAAGGFIYIAASDLIPEIKKETNLEKSLLNFIIFIFGIFIMYFIKFI